MAEWPFGLADNLESTKEEAESLRVSSLVRADEDRHRRRQKEGNP